MSDIEKGAQVYLRGDTTKTKWTVTNVYAAEGLVSMTSPDLGEQFVLINDVRTTASMDSLTEAVHRGSKEVTESDADQLGADTLRKILPVVAPNLPAALVEKAASGSIGVKYGLMAVTASFIAIREHLVQGLGPQVADHVGEVLIEAAIAAPWGT